MGLVERIFLGLSVLASVRLAGTTYCEWHLERFRGRINYTDDPWSFQVDPSCTSLSFSTLAYGALDDAGASALAATLEGLPQLAELNLGWNNIGDVGAASLAASLRHCPKLWRLQLAWNGIGDEGVAALADNLRWLPELEDLSIFWNNFGPIGVSALVKGLEKSQALKRLNLAWNNVGDAGAIEIANSFQHWPRLVEVSLAWSNVGSAGIRAIAAALPWAREIQDLRIKWNEFDDFAGAALAHAVAALEASLGGDAHIAVSGLSSTLLAAARNTTNHNTSLEEERAGHVAGATSSYPVSEGKCINDETTELDKDAITCKRTKCHALVIGNANYSKARLAPEALAATKQMGARLKALGFAVTQLSDGSRKDMRSAIKQFSEDVKAGEVSLVYFSGHALQKGGANYLLPIDAPTASAKLEAKAIALSGLLNGLQVRGAAANVIVVDACYENPYGGDEKGLAPLSAPAGALTVLSAVPGTAVEVVAGETLEHGRYTRHLLSQLEKSALGKATSLEEVFRRVRRLVAKETQNKQVPWEASALAVDFVIGGPTMTV